MVWFKGPPKKPAVTASITLSAVIGLPQLVSCLNDSDHLLSQIKEIYSTEGKIRAQYELTTGFELHAASVESMCETSLGGVGGLAAAKESATKDFVTTASQYIEYRIQEAKKWLKEQP